MPSSDEPNQPKSGGAAQHDQSTKPPKHPDQSKPDNPHKDEPIQQYLYKPRRPKQVQA